MIPALCCFFIAWAGAASGPALDHDADGIPASTEELLGTDPNRADSLRQVIDDGLESPDHRRRGGYDATKDVLNVAFCHVAEDRQLWRVTLAETPRMDETVLHLYVDADANSGSGRKGTPKAAYYGTDYMLSIVGGRASSSHFHADGTRSSGPAVTYAVQGRSVLVSADVPLARDPAGIRYGLYVLCHSKTPAGVGPTMSDHTRQVVLSKLGVSRAKKILRPRDHADNFRVNATFGLDLVRSVLRRDDVVVVGPDRLELDGFEIDRFTSRRWGHLRRTKSVARATCRVPKGGRYHVGFMMYDDTHDERVGIRIDGRPCGVAVANKNNRRMWLYWLAEAVELTGSQRIELRALGSSGSHGVCNVLLLPNPPKVRAVGCAVRYMTAKACPENPGRVTLSWVTTWPSRTRLAYGKTPACGTEVAGGADGRCLVHRVVLEGLDASATYHARATGDAPGGGTVRGQEFTFRASPARSPATRTGVRAVPLTVHNDHAHALDAWPTTLGVPIPQGELAGAGSVRLLGPETRPADVQVRVSARWPDGSVKWLLATFFASVPAKGKAAYVLEYGRDVRPAPAPAGLTVRRDADGLAVDTGAIRFRIDRTGRIADVRRGQEPLLSPGGVCETIGTDEAGARYRPAGRAECTVEEAGPLRAVVRVASDLAGAKGPALLRVEKRIEAYRHSAMLRVHHTIVVTRPELFTRVKDLSYRIPVAGGATSWRLPRANGQAVSLAGAGASAFQRFDDEFVVGAEGKNAPTKGRLVGAALPGSGGTVAVAVRDFWQNYPKALTVRPSGLYVGLCPAFEAGVYDRFPFEKQGHHLYFYLRGGRYQLKRGVSKTHELLLCFARPPRRAGLCSAFGRPPIAMAQPAWICGTKAFYDVAPRDEQRFALYERSVDRNLAAYAARRERAKDYGLLNYGDWYGERGSNWGNIEYDTQHAMFLEFIRSGNPLAWRLGESAELHNRDVDTIHWAPAPGDVGAVYVHQMGHVGDYYDRSVPGTLGFPRGGFTVSHAWVEGHFAHFFLTGDRRSYNTGRAIADYFIRRQMSRPYDFLTTRVPGWHLIMNASALAATGDPYYLNASRVIVDRVIETQDVQPRPLGAYQAKGRKPYQVGGWSRMMRPGHCRCEPRHRGNAGFMVAVLLSGLKYTHDVTGEERIKECIIRGAHYLLDETYSESVKGFRYTSCPKTAYRAGASPLMVEGIARAYLWTKDARLGRVLTEALPRGAGGSGYGKGFSMYYRAGPRVLADLKAAGLSLPAK